MDKSEKFDRNRTLGMGLNAYFSSLTTPNSMEFVQCQWQLSVASTQIFKNMLGRKLLKNMDQRIVSIYQSAFSNPKLFLILSHI